MSRVDIDIYVSQVISFFDKNPNELHILIGDLDRDYFFNKIREIAEKNHENGEDINLTRSQMIDIVVKMHEEIKEQRVVNVPFMETKFGDICLN